jgi:hypothetical protein
LQNQVPGFWHVQVEAQMPLSPLQLFAKTHDCPNS